MTMMDKVNASANTLFNMIFDKEELNYVEAAAVQSLVGQGRYNIVALQVMYNHAQDSDLKKLVKQAMDDQTKSLMQGGENLLEERGAKMPNLHFRERSLHDKLDIPGDARMTDPEIAYGLATMAKASQLALLMAMHQTYQPEIAMMYRKILDEALDFNYRLMQLMLKKGWLPELSKVKH